MLDGDRIAQSLTARLGVAFNADVQRIADRNVAFVRALDIPAPNGFSVQITAGWRSVDAEFVPDGFAGALIRSMGDSEAGARAAFAKLASAFASVGARISVKVNRTPVADASALPPSPWMSFDIKVHRMSAASEEGTEAIEREAVAVASMSLALLLSLLPLDEEAPESSAASEAGLPEGALMRVEVNRYERSAVNRAACMAMHGSACKACGFEFGEMYGQIGSGYVEVHHLVPVSEMGGEYSVNPATDLVPLCANCHAIVHRRNPPLSLGELKSLISVSAGTTSAPRL